MVEYTNIDAIRFYQHNHKDREMTDCEKIGMGGGCGFECSVFLDGECAIADEVADGADHKDMELYLEIYGE